MAMYLLSRNRFRQAGSLLCRNRFNYTSAFDSSGFILDGTVAHSSDFLANKAAMDKLVAQHRAMTAKIYEGGGEKAQKKLRSRNSLPVRDRVKGLLDSGSPFLEIGLFGALDKDMYEDYVPCGGIVTGIGSINGYVHRYLCHIHYPHNTYIHYTQGPMHAHCQ